MNYTDWEKTAEIRQEKIKQQAEQIARYEEGLMEVGRLALRNRHLNITTQFRDIADKALKAAQPQGGSNDPNL